MATSLCPKNLYEQRIRKEHKRQSVRLDWTRTNAAENQPRRFSNLSCFKDSQRSKTTCDGCWSPEVQHLRLLGREGGLSDTRSFSLILDLALRPTYWLAESSIRYSPRFSSNLCKVRLSVPARGKTAAYHLK